MISSVFEFGDTIAREVMVPRPDIIAMHTNYYDIRWIAAICGRRRAFKVSCL